MLQRRVLLEHQLRELAQAERTQRPPLCGAAEVFIKPVCLPLGARETKPAWSHPACHVSAGARRGRACSTKNRSRSKDCSSSAGHFRMKREQRSCSRSGGGTVDPGAGAAAWPPFYARNGTAQQEKRMRPKQHAARVPSAPCARQAVAASSGSVQWRNAGFPHVRVRNLGRRDEAGYVA